MRFASSGISKMTAYFWRALSGVACTLFLIGGLFAYFFLGPVEDDAPIFQAAERPPISQERFFSTKDLLYTNETGERMQLRVRGKKERLFIEKQGGEYLMTEHMTGVKAFLQEKIVDGEEQPLAYLEAEEAEYDNSTGLITASDVKIFRFLTSSFENLKGAKPLMEGFADEIQFSLLEKSGCFTATGFHAHFQGRK
jgi:hypothetical protein